MDTRRSTMNYVLFYVVPAFRLTGSTINAIEYFLAGYEYNRKLKLILINSSLSFRKKIIKIIKERYILDGIEDFETNILHLKKSDLPSLDLDTVLVLDYVTINQTKGIINPNKLLVISEKLTEVEEYFYNKSLYNVTYYGEMPFHYKDKKYRMKCLFSRYKALGDVQKGTYVNSPKNDNFYQRPYNPLNDVIDSFLHLPKPFIFKSKTKPEENLFEKFTDYLYYHADKWFDPHPRLFLECRFYNKCITYSNPHKVKDGSWYRFNDLQMNGLHNRTLNEEDEIIKQLI